MPNQGGESLMLFHCSFNGDGTVTHYVHDMLEDIYKRLPNMYAVIIADNSTEKRRLVGGFVIKTSKTDEDPDFIETLRTATCVSNDLMGLLNPKTSFLPARIGVQGESPITEDEMLTVINQQYFKHAQ